MLFRETVAVYCENHAEHTDTHCGQNEEILYMKRSHSSRSPSLYQLSYPDYLYIHIVRN
jgi:hypothetical protein